MVSTTQQMQLSLDSTAYCMMENVNLSSNGQSESQLKELLDRYVVHDDWRIGEAVYFCPYCQYHKPRLQVNLSKAKYYCWQCSHRGEQRPGGSVFELIKYAATQVGEWTQARSELSLIFPLYSDDNDNKAKQPVWNYNKLLRICDSNIPTHCEDFLASKRIEKWAAAEYGIRYNAKHDSIVVPEFDSSGNCVSYYERNFNRPQQKATRVFSDTADKRIALNCNFDSHVVVLVEGPFDAIATQCSLVTACNFGKQPVAIVPLGCTGLPQRVYDLVHRASSVIVACDYDWAGINGTRKVAAKFIAKCHDDVRVANYDLWTHHNPAQCDFDLWIDSVTTKAIKTHTLTELKFVLSKHNARLRNL